MAERLEVLVSGERIRAEVVSLARRIDADYRTRRLSLVIVLKGAFVFAADLMRQIATPCTTDFISAASYGTATRSSGTVVLDAIDDPDLAGRDVLVIEDILDTGQTSAAVLDHLKQHEPASLELCALLRKPQAASLGLPVRYVGFEIPDEFVVGYGMDYAERYRSLPGIHRLVFDESGKHQVFRRTSPVRTRS